MQRRIFVGLALEVLLVTSQFLTHLIHLTDANIVGLSVEEQSMLRQLKPDTNDVAQFEQAHGQVGLLCYQFDEVAELAARCGWRSDLRCVSLGRERHLGLVHAFIDDCFLNVN